MSEQWSHKPPVAPLTVEGLRLRLPDSSDVDALVRFGGDPDIAETLWVPIPSPCPREVAEARIREFRQGWSGPSRFGPTLVVADAETDEMVGVVFLHRRDSSRVEIAYGVAPQQRNQGVATRALECAGQWCFDVLDARQVELRIGVSNVASQCVAEKAGYERRGIERTHVPGTGEEYDDVLYVRVSV